MYIFIYKYIYFIYSSSYVIVSLLKRDKINRTQRQIYKGRYMMGWAYAVIKLSIHRVGYLLLVNKGSSGIIQFWFKDLRIEELMVCALVRGLEAGQPGKPMSRSRERWMSQTNQFFLSLPLCSMWAFRWIENDKLPWLTSQNANAF